MKTKLDHNNKLAEIRKVLNTIKAENAQLIKDNKLIMEGIKNRLPIA